MSIHLGFHVRELWRMRISIALMDGLTDLSCNNLWLDPSVHESLSKSCESSSNSVEPNAVNRFLPRTFLTEVSITNVVQSPRTSMCL
ncbi:predicted protein [Arabidopsis lyrata subsp. lyrata]|uniref:Predicted protein n=1 Tax=Arabidopsis lyrata subsp. lyrata TaxID=81972 RepID=D7KKD1_ARALL|nr:predicted protein [Arabidopsis lyrata subsp. lyrata]